MQRCYKYGVVTLFSAIPVEDLREARLRKLELEQKLVEHKKVKPVDIQETKPVVQPTVIPSSEDELNEDLEMSLKKGKPQKPTTTQEPLQQRDLVPKVMKRPISVGTATNVNTNSLGSTANSKVKSEKGGLVVAY